MDNAAVAGLTVTTMVAAVDMFARVLPAPHAIAGQPASPAGTAAVRAQCRSVLPMVLALGAGASLLAKSPWPIVGAAGAVAWMWWQYETAAGVDGGQLAAATPAPQPGRYVA